MRVKVKRKAKAKWHPNWKETLEHAATWGMKELGIFNGVSTGASRPTTGASRPTTGLSEPTSPATANNNPATANNNPATANNNPATAQSKVEIHLKWSPKEDYAGLALTLIPFSRFVIILNGCYLKDEKDIFETVFHELTHVKQEIHEGLYFDDIHEAHYRGLVYKFESEEEYAQAYYDLPWEIEARENEKILGDKYAKLFY